MTKILTGNTLPCIVRKKHNPLITNFLLTVAMVVLITLLILLLPFRLLNRRLSMAARWIMSKYQ